MMTKLFLIALGGSLGAPLRYLINHSMKDFYLFMLPSGIMLVNFIGCFFIGIAMAYASDFKSNTYYLLIVGFLALLQQCQPSHSKQLNCYTMERN